MQENIIVLIENDFSCSDSVSVANMNRNNENLMTLGCFVYHNSQFVIYSQRPVENIDF